MSVFPGVPVDAAYHVVSALAGLLTPLPGGLAAAAAIVGFTAGVRLVLLPLSYRAMRGMEAQARLAPRVQALRKQHAGQPDRLRRELAALQESEGASLLGGCLPVLLQWPFLSVMYLLFRSPRIGGARNALLTHHLFGAPLGSHWLGGGGPLSTQGAVFAGLFVLLAAVGWLSARIARRFAGADAPAPVPPGLGAAGGAVSPAAGRPGGAVSRRAGQSGGAVRPAAGRPGGPVSPAAGGSGGPAAAVAGLLPFATVVVAAFVPLAAGLYLVTSTAWTLAERMFLRRRLTSRISGPRADAAEPHPGPDTRSSR
jgi:YidC/Oxa1 family membrane protein insertase